MLRSFLVALGFFLVAPQLLGVTANFSGMFRSRANYLQNGNLNEPTVSSTKTYLDGRALIYPSLVIDDHFAVKSQWSLVDSPYYLPNRTFSGGNGQGGWVYGDPNAKFMTLSRAWMEWTSDFGVFRLGRVPVAWGYGLVWDAGNGMWDDWQSTIDRIEYRLHFGHLVSTLAYSKPRKGSLMASDDDADHYTVSIKYENPELDMEFGGLYEKQNRSISQAGALGGATNGTATGPGSSNPYASPYGFGQAPYSPTRAFPLSSSGLAAPLSDTILDIYAKKSTGHFTFGGEVTWLSGSATTYPVSTNTLDLNAWGFLFSASYEYHRLKTFLEFLYASGDSDMSNGAMTGFAIMHRNRRAGILLGRELLGPYNGDTANSGSMFAYGNTGSFSGVYYLRPGLRMDWSPTWSTGVEVIWAQKAAVQDGEDRSLGLEIDIGTEYSVYKNFDVGLTMAVLTPGRGLGGTSTPTVFGFQTTFGLKF
ncbi:MAG: hypothetical protein HYR96_04215 [Deltaproteobacteria bacterium]|nr:hypothetical protein [Deltaproteobacteria bacterium]MBI3295520.1 hypothetical protein [Deltaproteobacteria bacterium]